MMVDRYNKTPLYIQVKEEITRAIISGRWEISSQIPTEKELMEKYEVGRATIRQAIDLLVNQGYLYKKQGIGTFVLRDKPSLGFEPLISLTFTLRTKGIKVSNKVLKERFFISGKELTNKMRWRTAEECLYVKRLRSVEGIPVAIENSYFSQRFSKGNSNLDFEKSLASMIINDLKVEISKVDQTITIRIPNKEEKKLLEIDDTTRVLVMERWIYEENNKEPFYYLNFIVPENLYYVPIVNY
jgi:GntR family transcriptional regulator